MHEEVIEVRLRKRGLTQSEHQPQQQASAVVVSLQLGSSVKCPEDNWSRFGKLAWRVYEASYGRLFARSEKR
jgi:hypothetical protein